MEPCANSEAYLNHPKHYHQYDDGKGTSFKCQECGLQEYFIIFFDFKEIPFGISAENQNCSNLC